MFPDLSLQALLGNQHWWDKQSTPVLCRGSIVWAYAPHVDQMPYTFEPVGRKDAEVHTSAIVKVAPLSIDQPLVRSQLPVAAMPAHPGEVWAAYRAKRRPCLVISCNNPVVDPSLTRGMANNATAPTCLVAPYYGVRQSEKRAGYQAAFVERVRRCEFPQFMWDVLPFPNGEESILRLDHIQPIGTHYKAYKPAGYELCEDAMMILDEILGWLIKGGVPDNGYISMYRKAIEEIAP